MASEIEEVQDLVQQILTLQKASASPETRLSRDTDVLLDQRESKQSSPCRDIASALPHVTRQPSDEEVDVSLGEGPEEEEEAHSEAEATAAATADAAELHGSQGLDAAESYPCIAAACEASSSNSSISTSTCSSSSSSTSPAVKVKVREPERAKLATAMGLKSSHHVYAIVTDSSLPGMLANGVEVRRMFSEFEALHEVLHIEWRGAFIPPLPEKAFFENGSDGFLRTRRADLQAFLQSIVSHPLLQQSAALRIFLLLPGELTRTPGWSVLVQGLAAGATSQGATGLGSAEEHDAEHALAPHRIASSSGGGALKSLGSWVSRIKSSTAAAFQPPRRELPAGEAVLRQAKMLLQDLERLLQLATDSARTMCHDMDKMAADFHDFGFNMSRLSKYEDAVREAVGSYTPEGQSASRRGADLQQLAMCHAKQTMAWKTLAAKSAASLVTLLDYHLLMPEAVRALTLREKALDRVFELEDELANNAHQLYELQASEGGKGLLRSFSLGPASVSRQEKRSYQLTQRIQQLEDELHAAHAAYRVIKERNQSELARLGLEREADFRRMMAVFAGGQAKMVGAAAGIWSVFADKLTRSGQE